VNGSGSGSYLEAGFGINSVKISGLTCTNITSDLTTIDS
jgi:hypothetical protein